MHNGNLIVRMTFALALALAAGPVLAAGETAASPTGAPRLQPGPSFLNRTRGQNGGTPGVNRAAPAGLRGGSPEFPNDVTKVAPGGRNIEFSGAAVDIVLKVYGELVGKTVLKDPATPTPTITFQPLQGQELTDEEKIHAIETVLEMNGVHIEPYGEKFVRAVPGKGVRTYGIPLYMDPATPLGETTRIVSLMFQFRNIAVEEAQKVLEGFKSANGALNVIERNNGILVTDTEANINRMREVIQAIDIAMPITENVYVRKIEHALAANIKTALEAIVQDSQKEQEKNGKRPNTAQTQPQGYVSPFRRPGQPQQPQQPAAVAAAVAAVSDADRGMIRGKVLILADENSNKLIIVTSKPNMDFFDKVIEALDEEATQDTGVWVMRLKYADAEDVSDMINDLIGNAPSSKNSKSNQKQASAGSSGGATRGNLTSGTTTAARKSVNQRTGEAKTGELSKENTTVLADKRINGLVVMTDKALFPAVSNIVEKMDVKLSQVLIETCIIEVTLGDDLKTGIDWVQKGRYREDQATVTRGMTGANGQPVYNFYAEDSSGNRSVKSFESIAGQTSITDSDGTIWTRFGDQLTESVTVAGELVKGDYMTGNAGYAQALGGGAFNGSVAADVVDGVATNFFGSAFNYMFTSDKLNLTAVIQASKTDSRTKYLASPIIMTVDNKEATIDATESRKFFSGYETSSSYSTYMRTPKYDSKDIGIKIKVTPKINPNGTVMLQIEEEYSQVIEGGQSILVGDGAGKELIDTSLQRKMSADALLENMQTVILCGLTETYTAENESGIPILKDIPWIGKWLFSSVSQKENRKELLIFMTPYVLNDAEAAESEAIRRKKTLSDARAWNDHGWSTSKLADPISKKEQMRRLKEEWKKQDEERQTQLAIEKAKLERAKKLKELSKEERDLWLKMHKEELEEEQQEELEKKMRDKDSQEELSKLAEKVRMRSLAEAEKEIKAGEEKVKSENERARIDAEKAAEKQAEKAAEKQAEKPVEPVAAPAAATQPVVNLLNMLSE